MLNYLEKPSALQKYTINLVTHVELVLVEIDWPFMVILWFSKFVHSHTPLDEVNIALNTAEKYTVACVVHIVYTTIEYYSVENQLIVRQ